MSVLARGCRAVAALMLTMTVTFALSDSPAMAATITDNLVPTGTFSSYCQEGSPGNANPCQTDNAHVYFYMDSHGDYKLESEDDDVVRCAMNEYGNDTQLTTTYDGTPVFSGSGETDTIYQEGSVPGSDTGYTWCNDDSLGGYRCDQQYVRIEGGGNYTRGVTCHESGHAVGLAHGNQAYPTTQNDNDGRGCLRKPTYTNQLLGANSIGNINNVY